MTGKARGKEEEEEDHTENTRSTILVSDHTENTRTTIFDHPENTRLTILQHHCPIVNSNSPKCEGSVYLYM